MSVSCLELKDTVTVCCPSFSGVNTSLYVTFFSYGNISLYVCKKKKNYLIYLQLTTSNEISNNIIPKFNDFVNSWSFYTKRAIGQHDR